MITIIFNASHNPIKKLEKYMNLKDDINRICQKVRNRSCMKYDLQYLINSYVSMYGEYIIIRKFIEINYEKPETNPFEKWILTKEYSHHKTLPNRDVDYCIGLIRGMMDIYPELEIELEKIFVQAKEVENDYEIFAKNYIKTLDF